MKRCIEKYWLISLLLFSPLLWAEVPVNPQELKAIEEIEKHIEPGSLFAKLRRTDKPEIDADLIASYGVDKNGHIASLNLTRLTHNDLKFLRAFPHLRFLTIKRSPALTSMQGVESNTRLEKLWLMDVPISRIEGLEKMERLTLLSIHEGRLTSMAGVKNLEALEHLVLSYNALERLEGLEHLTRLKNLDLPYNPISSMRGLGDKPELKELVIYETNIRKLEDYDSLSKMQIAVDEDFSFEDNEEAVKELEKRGVEIYRI